MPKKILVIIIFFFFSSVLQAEEFKKIVNLDKPWGSSFINENELIITEKKGKIKIININSSEIFEVIHNLNFKDYGQGGLLDIIYKNNGLWISYTEDRGDWKTSTSIAKADFNRKNLSFKNIFQANPPIDSGYHFGSRLVI